MSELTYFFFTMMVFDKTEMTFTSSTHDTRTYWYTSNKFNTIRYFDRKNFTVIFCNCRSSPSQWPHTDKTSRENEC